MYTIGRLAQRAKVNPDSIRFYERQGLLSAATKTDSGYRLYTDDAVRRILFIKRAQRCGFSLADIRELLHVHQADPSAKIHGYRLAAQKKAEIENTVETLHAMRDALSHLIASRAHDAANAATGPAESPLFAVLDAVRSDSDTRRATSGPGQEFQNDRRFASA
jgi:MerR family Zn(II)-responsive transcriptional regulator of zntA